LICLFFMIVMMRDMILPKGYERLSIEGLLFKSPTLAWQCARQTHWRKNFSKTQMLQQLSSFRTATSISNLNGILAQ